jgi:hypothetical protein
MVGWVHDVRPEGVDGDEHDDGVSRERGRARRRHWLRGNGERAGSWSLRQLPDEGGKKPRRDGTRLAEELVTHRVWGRQAETDGCEHRGSYEDAPRSKLSGGLN